MFILTTWFSASTQFDKKRETVSRFAAMVFSCFCPARDLTLTSATAVAASSFVFLSVALLGQIALITVLIAGKAVEIASPIVVPIAFPTLAGSAFAGFWIMSRRLVPNVKTAGVLLVRNSPMLKYRGPDAYRP